MMAREPYRAVWHIHRGFRLGMQYCGDNWRWANFLNFGCVYLPGVPHEVNMFSVFLWCDCNNLAPRFGSHTAVANGACCAARSVGLRRIFRPISRWFNPRKVIVCNPTGRSASCVAIDFNGRTAFATGGIGGPTVTEIQLGAKLARPSACRSVTSDVDHTSCHALVYNRAQTSRVSPYATIFISGGDSTI